MAGDSGYGNVLLLLHCDGDNDSTTFVDSSLTPKTVTSVSGAKISTAQSKFGGAAGLFNGSTDYLTVPYNAGFDLPSDFTIETWVYFTGYANIWGGYYGQCIAGRYQGGTAPDVGWHLTLMGTASSFTGLNFQTGLSSLDFACSPALNTWHHIAISRAAGVVKAFLDGAQIGSSISNTNSLTRTATNILTIGRLNDPSYTYSLKGYIDDFRITKGVGRYTANFTPPASAFADYQSQLSGTITEYLAASTFIADAHDATTGVLAGTKTFTGNSFTVDIKAAVKACNVTVRIPYEIWTASTVYALDDLVFPLDPITTPYYYKRIAAGASGATEPTWATTPGAQVNDGAVTNAWELVERLVQPITHGPLIPS